MDRPAVDIQKDVFAVLLKLMNFGFHLHSPYNIVNEKSLPQTGEGTVLGQLLFADLVAYCAGSLASRLAGCLALAAAARLQGLLHGRLVDRLDMLHS
jgi:hypothetical protein